MMRAEKEIKRQKEKALVEMKEEVGMLAVMAAEKIMEKD
jgi:F0F1-type ATP synthase membrane subunit b/b'